MPQQERKHTKTETHSKANDRPRYKREAPLREAYEAANGRISEAADEFDDVSYWTVRKYLIENGIHEPEKLEDTSPSALLEAADPDDVRADAATRRKLGLVDGGQA